jgi:hypothetical protein
MHSHYLQLYSDCHVKNNNISDNFKRGPGGLCFMFTYIHILVFETSGAGPSYASRTHVFTPGFSGFTLFDLLLSM